MPLTRSERYPITPPHRSGAAERSSRPSGMGTRWSARTTIRSAKPPSRSHPWNSAATGSLPSGSAEPAHLARGREPVRADAPADVRRRNARPHLDDAPDRLVPRNDRQAPRHQVALRQLQVGPAHRAGVDPEHDLAGAGAGSGRFVIRRGPVDAGAGCSSTAARIGGSYARRRARPSGPERAERCSSRFRTDAPLGRPDPTRRHGLPRAPAR